MKIPQIEPLIGRDEEKAVLDYMRSGGYLTEYKLTAKFEEMIAEYIGSKFAIITSSGTTALMCALMSLGLKRDDEVLVPDFTMIASANSVKLAGYSPILIDVDSQNLCLDLKKAEEAITSRTKALLYVAINGRSHSMPEVSKFCSDHELTLVEDSAQALCSKNTSKYLGSFGLMGCFSFSFPKVITTGQGGAIVTDSEGHQKTIRMIKDFGRSKSGVDEHEILGFNAKFTDLQAAIGIEQFRKIDDRVRRKREISSLYYETLQNEEHIELIRMDSEAILWFVDILVRRPEDRDKLASYLLEREIGTRRFYPAIHTQRPYEGVKGAFPVSENISARGLWLPSSLTLTDEDVLTVCREVRQFFRNK